GVGRGDLAPAPRREDDDRGRHRPVRPHRPPRRPRHADAGRAALGRLGRAKGAEADVRESPFLLVTLCYLTGLRLTGALRRPCNTVLLAGDQRERRLGKQRDALLEPRRAGVLLRQLAANEPAVDRLAEHRGLPERERLEPLERLDVAAALDGGAVGGLTPRGEPRQRGDRRGAQRIRLAAGLA